MALDWDTVAGITGLDLAPLRNGGVRLDHAQRAIGIYVPSTALETATAFSTYVDRKSIADDPTIICDIYDPASLVPGPPTTVTFAPNEDGTFTSTGGGTILGSPTDTVGNRYQNIDEVVRSDTDYIRATAAGGVNTAIYRFRVASGVGLGAGVQTISAVRVKFAVGVTNSAGTQVSMTMKLQIGGVDYAANTGGSVNFGSSSSPISTYTAEWTTNPATGLAWTEADVQDFDSSSWVTMTASLATSSPTFPFMDFTWAAMEVAYNDEGRLATGSLTVTAAGWQTFTLASFSKASGTNYIALLRRTSTVGWCVIPTFDAGVAALFGHKTYQPTMSAAGQITALGSALTPVAPAVYTISGPAASVDSQPYVTARFEQVDTNSTLKQEITAGATETIGWLRLVARAARITGPTQALLAKIKRSSDNVQMGGTITFGTELVTEDPLTFRALDDTLSSTASIVSGTQYYIELTCTSADGYGWEVPVLDAKTPPQSANTKGFGGTTDRAEVAAVENDNYDVPVVWGTVPTAPAGFTATANTSGEGSIDLAWTATALGASFDRYEIEHLRGSVWRRVANVQTEAVTGYVVEHVKRGTSESFRIRVRHTNGTVSLPSSTASATLTKDGYFLICPETPSLSREIELLPDPGFATPRERVEEARYGRRFVSVTQGDDDRGVILTGAVYSTDASSGALAASEWMRTVADADVSQFVLVNGSGERWIVSVEFLDGTVVRAFGDTGDWQTRAIRFVEIDDVPVVVEVT